MVAREGRMRPFEALSVGGLGLMLCAAAIVPAITMGGRAEADPLRVGDPAPGLVVSAWVQGGPDANGGAFNTLTVLVFWATYCPPCRDALPVLSALQQKYADKGVRILCVGGESRKTTEMYIRTASPPLRQSFALDNQWITHKRYLDGLGVVGIPYAVIVGRDGRIAWHGNPLTDGIEGKIRDLLAMEPHRNP